MHVKILKNTYVQFFFPTNGINKGIIHVTALQLADRDRDRFML